MDDEFDRVRLAAMSMAETMFGPMHEMINGEVARFVRDGFTFEQARALTAAEFVGTFGAAVRRSATLPEDDE